MRAFFIMVYPHHLSQIYCEHLYCDPPEHIAPDRFISFGEAKAKGWSQTVKRKFSTGWICPECNENKNE